jgi:predicted Zn-dependent protease
VLTLRLIAKNVGNMGMMRSSMYFLLLAMFVYCNLVSSQENIDLPDFGDSAGAIISPEQERKLGENFVRQMRKLAPLVVDEEIEDYVRGIGENLAEHADYYGDFQFFVIDSPVINAFAVPGGFVAFHTGLILETEHEAELASVMGHEISHVTQRHGARMIEAGQRMNMPAMAAMFGAIVLAAVNPEAGMAALMATQAAAQQFQINFTRSNEKEADSIGIRLMADAGYDTTKMSTFFEKMMRASRYSDPRYIPEYLRTHPITINRISAAYSRAKTVRPEIAREDSYSYHLVKAKLKVRAAADPAQAVRAFDSILKRQSYAYEEVARYGYALALTEAGDFIKARAELEDLILQFPTVVPYRTAAGALEKRARDYARSAANFKQAYELESENRAAVYGYVDALITLGRAEQAKSILTEYGLSDRRDPRFFNLLAQAENLLGQTVKEHSALAEYYLSVGQFPHAAEQLRLARRTKGLSNYQRQKLLYRLDEVEQIILDLEEPRR